MPEIFTEIFCCANKIGKESNEPEKNSYPPKQTLPAIPSK